MVLEGKRLLPVSNTCLGESMKTGRTYKEETSWVKIQKLIKAFDNSKSWLKKCWQFLILCWVQLSSAEFSWAGGTLSCLFDNVWSGVTWWHWWWTGDRCLAGQNRRRACRGPALLGEDTNIWKVKSPLSFNFHKYMNTNFAKTNKENTQTDLTSVWKVRLLFFVAFPVQTMPCANELIRNILEACKGECQARVTQEKCRNFV